METGCQIVGRSAWEQRWIASYRFGLSLLVFGIVNVLGASAQESSDISAKAGEILNKYCYRCHRGSGAPSSRA